MKKGRDMRLKNFLIVVNNIEKSRQFYHDLFGLQMILDNDGNMILTEGLVLQEVKYVNRLMTHSWGQKVIRFYDPDGNLIEVGTPM